MAASSVRSASAQLSSVRSANVLPASGRSSDVQVLRVQWSDVRTRDVPSLSRAPEIRHGERTMPTIGPPEKRKSALKSDYATPKILERD